MQNPQAQNGSIKEMRKERGVFKPTQSRFVPRPHGQPNLQGTRGFPTLIPNYGAMKCKWGGSYPKRWAANNGGGA